jgi:formimidoylglutamate deiminase
MTQISTQIWATKAYVSNAGGNAGWQSKVLLTIDSNGCWQSIQCNVDQPASALATSGPLLPSFVNAHSHAFQRAFAGMTEQRQAPKDDFWSWRQAMYGVAQKITPDQLRAIAAHLYVELLKGGYTQVCEFHYLSQQPNGEHYPDRLAMTWALADAAQQANIGLTVMPVLYERAGFGSAKLLDEQKRFAQSARSVWDCAKAIDQSQRPLLNAGLAIHSLRAASVESIVQLRQLAIDFNGPIHIHVAEQTGEVQDCLTATGARPIQWLAQNKLLDARWHLVHATHASQSEIESVASNQAALVICPTTEANLGDGLANLPKWLETKIPLTIGSDSHACRDALEELRWLEYGQRLSLRQRNISADAIELSHSCAQNLVDLTMRSSAKACGAKAWGITLGARADALVLDLDQPNLLGVPEPYWLDAAMFSAPSHAWKDVLVNGHWVIRDRAHVNQDSIAEKFVRVMRELWHT